MKRLLDKIGTFQCLRPPRLSIEFRHVRPSPFAMTLPGIGIRFAGSCLPLTLPSYLFLLFDSARGALMNSILLPLMFFLSWLSVYLFLFLPLSVWVGLLFFYRFDLFASQPPPEPFLTDQSIVFWPKFPPLNTL